MMQKELLGSYHYVSGKGVLQGDTKVFAARSGITSIGVIRSITKHLTLPSPGNS